MTRHSQILTNLLLSLPVAAGLLCAAPSASAQTSEHVTIPFAFSADHQQVAAGPYKVELLSDRFLSLYNVKTEKTQVLMVRPEDGQAMETHSRMVFHREGTDYSLTQVRIAGTSSYSTPAVQSGPRQVTAKNAQPAGSTLEVAMK